MIRVPQVGETGNEGAAQHPRSVLVGIIRPRIEETMELVRERLEAGGYHRAAGRRLVLTGGASLLHGVPELAARILDKQVRIGRPIKVSGLAESTGGPAFAACAGLLNHALHGAPEAMVAGAREEDTPGGPLVRFWALGACTFVKALRRPHDEQRGASRHAGNPGRAVTFRCRTIGG